MTKPITPDEALEALLPCPPEVFEVFNSLLRGNKPPVTVPQRDVMERLLKALPNVQRHEVFANHWLDIEASYESAGWDVSYSKPGYNEEGEAFWTFDRAGAKRVKLERAVLRVAVRWVRDEENADALDAFRAAVSALTQYEKGKRHG